MDRGDKIRAGSFDNVGGSRRDLGISFPVSKSGSADKVRLTIVVPGNIYDDMIRLRIRPSDVLVRAFRKEIKVRELLEKWRKAKQSDPNLTMVEVAKESRRIRRILGE